MIRKDELNIESLATQFWEQGYIELPDFFDLQYMHSLQALILQHFGDAPQFSHDPEFIEKSKAEVIPWFPQREGERLFDKIENDPALKALSEAILGSGWSNQYCMVMYSKPGTAGQAWHQDCPPEDHGAFNLNRLMYTMDVNEQVGGQVVVKPGSHKMGELSAGELFEDFADQVVITPKAGTLVLIHGHCWHRVEPVKSQYRISTNFRALPSDVAEDITDICVYRNMRYQFSTSTVLVER